MSYENEDKNVNIETPVETEKSKDELQTPEKPLYRWTFSEQYDHDEKVRAVNKRKDNKGARAYAAIMTVAFVISIALLIGTMFIGDGIIVPKYQDRTIYVRQLDGESDILTVPEISSKCNPSVVCISTKMTSGESTGTGIIKSTDGYILTNYHVVEGYSRIIVTLYNGNEYIARFIGGDAQADVALIKIEAPNLVAAEFGDSDNLIQGEDVVAIGMPAGRDYGWSITKGIISGINRDVKFYEGGNVVKTMTVIQTDTSINKGNSGGPLINYYGEVIGINTLKLADGYESMGFAIPIKIALSIADDIALKGPGYVTAAPERAALGIMGIEVTIEEGYDKNGILIDSFVDNICDASKKLKVGDLIYKINGQEVVKIANVKNILQGKKPGDSINISYIRNDSTHTVDIVLTLA